MFRREKEGVQKMGQVIECRDIQLNDMNDIKQLVTDYYAKKVDELTKKMWESGELDQKRLDEINKTDLHQWLREQKAKENIEA